MRPTVLRRTTVAAAVRDQYDVRLRATWSATRSGEMPGESRPSASRSDTGAAPRPRTSHSVETGAGVMEWTRTPRAVTSRRSPLTNPCWPALVAE